MNSTENRSDQPRIVILQNSEGTPPGAVIEWLKSKNYRLDLRRLFAGDDLPKVEDTDWLISLGGSMNVDETKQHPWLALEKSLLKLAIEKQKTCLGLCLGGQLLAQVLGGVVEPNRHWEVGWFPVRMKDGATLPVFQFHQDHFSLPPGAERMASNEITENQAFIYRGDVIGIQFHPEATEAWVAECADEKPYPSGPYVQSPEAMRVDCERHMPAMRRWFFNLLDELEIKTLAKSGKRSK